MSEVLAPPPYTPSAWGAAYHSLPYDQVLGAGSAGPGKTTVLIWEPLAQIITEHGPAVTAAFKASPTVR